MAEPDEQARTKPIAHSARGQHARPLKRAEGDYGPNEVLGAFPSRRRQGMQAEPERSPQREGEAGYTLGPRELPAHFDPKSGSECELDADAARMPEEDLGPRRRPLVP